MDWAEFSEFPLWLDLCIRKIVKVGLLERKIDLGSEVSGKEEPGLSRVVL